MKFIKILSLFFSILLSIQVARALAIAQPIPSDVTLERGNSLPFKFEIQAITSREDQLCTYSVSGLTPLKVGFDEERALVKAGKVLSVFGTLEVPFNVPIKEYEGKLTIRCKPDIVVLGASLIVDTTEFPFLVKVIKSEKEERLGWEYLSASIFFGIIIILVWSGFRHKPKKRIIKKEEKSNESYMEKKFK